MTDKRTVVITLFLYVTFILAIVRDILRELKVIGLCAGKLGAAVASAIPFSSYDENFAMRIIISLNDEQKRLARLDILFVFQLSYLQLATNCDGYKLQSAFKMFLFYIYK